MLDNLNCGNIYHIYECIDIFNYSYIFIHIGSIYICMLYIYITRIFTKAKFSHKFHLCCLECKYRKNSANIYAMNRTVGYCCCNVQTDASIALSGA